MQNIRNSLQKPNQMSKRKSREVFLTDNKWPSAQRAQIFCLLLVWYENGNVVLLMKVQITRKWIKIHWPLYMHYAQTRVGDTLQ